MKSKFQKNSSDRKTAKAKTIQATQANAAIGSLALTAPETYMLSDLGRHENGPRLLPPAKGEEVDAKRSPSAEVVKLQARIPSELLCFTKL